MRADSPAEARSAAVRVQAGAAARTLREMQTGAPSTRWVGAVALLASSGCFGAGVPATSPPPEATEHALPAASRCALEWAFMPTRIAFPHGPALDREGREALRGLVDLLHDRFELVQTLRIEGHAARCEQGDPYERSLQYAFAVRAELEAFGMERSALSIRGHGDAHPLGDHFDCSDEGRRERRASCELSHCVEARVEVSVYACPRSRP